MWFLFFSLLLRSNFEVMKSVISVFFFSNVKSDSFVTNGCKHGQGHNYVALRSLGEIDLKVYSLFECL
jgi:hypothetical protein